jgi:hypothetical protein
MMMKNFYSPNKNNFRTTIIIINHYIAMLTAIMISNIKNSINKFLII